MKTETPREVFDDLLELYRDCVTYHEAGEGLDAECLELLSRFELAMDAALRRGATERN